MAETKRSAEALALIYLREARGWTQTELATAKGHKSHRVISRYENGKAPLSRAELHDMAALLGFSRDAVEALLFTYSLVSLPDLPEDGSPVALTPEELQRIDRAVLADGWTRATDLRARLIEDKKRKKAEAARQTAGELWARLKPLPSSARRELVGDSPYFWNWAFVERLCLESERAAANDPKEALALAELALSVTNRCELGGESWRLRLSGYAWAHKANALRVASDLAGADECFGRAWTLWSTCVHAQTGLLAEWRMFSMEASLRRDERNFTEALALLLRAEQTATGDSGALGVVLLNREFVFEQMGDISAALTAIKEATPYVEASGDLRRLFALRFKAANNLCHLERYGEAAALLPQIRNLAEGLESELDLVRVVWLAARIATGQGDWMEAIAGLEQVRREFSDRGIAFDAALSSLDLAVVYLKRGRLSEVKTLACEITPIFRSQGIALETLAALAIFVEAAQQETATIEMVRGAIADIEEARRKAPRPERLAEPRPEHL